MDYQITRRDFLKQSLLTASLSAAALPRLSASQPQTERKGAAKKVLVIGAGLAGLSAAYELSQAGHDVSILEARTRAGGRVRTLRAPFADGLYAEAGAANVYDSHDWTMKYIKLFGITLDPSMSSTLASLVYMRGQRIVQKSGQSVAWPFAFSPEEMKLTRGGLWNKYVSPVYQELGDAAAAAWPPAALQKYDQMTFLEFLQRQDPTPGALALLRLGFADQLGDGADAVSALDLLRESVLRTRMKQSFTIRGGSDTFPQAFATRLADKIRYGAPVVKIEHNAQGARVTCLRAGTQQSFSADHLVCALPFTCLRRVEITPRFSPAKQQAIEEVQLTSVTRTFLQTSKRFWLDEGLSGAALTDLPLQTIYDPSPHQPAPGPRGLLEVYTAGPQARRLAALKESERLRAAYAHAGKVFPALRAYYEGGAVKSWDEDEWARGAYTWFKPGQMSALLPHIARPEGRVHFAGEHASAWPGWMQGALEAGNRVAREINETL